ncbi:hypothetical protein T265_01816 [Opisthorchis viverrini]|uniref:Uncharacterized protein n=1 Tax=Opisthorchis viverrini TaxID=6198 RepID=A0A075A1A6_OPIVI|nr:hypothetical protein T265_01816 [Opisthorchis viverrini]KER32037.1 hypothetical protein T265_01816 [Opisthorchis viverrini]
MKSQPSKTFNDNMLLINSPSTVFYVENAMYLQESRDFQHGTPQIQECKPSPVEANVLCGIPPIHDNYLLFDG